MNKAEKFGKMLETLTLKAELVFLFNQEEGVKRVYVRPEGKRRFWRILPNPFVMGKLIKRVSYDPVDLARGRVRKGHYAIQAGPIALVHGLSGQLVDGPMGALRDRIIGLRDEGREQEAKANGATAAAS